MVSTLLSEQVGSRHVIAQHGELPLPTPSQRGAAAGSPVSGVSGAHQAGLVGEYCELDLIPEIELRSQKWAWTT